MPEPCAFCGEWVLLSKHNYDARSIQVNGKWERLIWHRACDPFKVTTTVTRKNKGEGGTP